jgi:hypothetical protein
MGWDPGLPPELQNSALAAKRRAERHRAIREGRWTPEESYRRTNEEWRKVNARLKLGGML